MKSLLAPFASLCIAASTFAAEQHRTNILFILVGDQSPSDFKFYNPKWPLQSPNIDRLAAEGMVLDGAYHSRAEGNIYLLDVLATMCDLTGVPAPESNESLSFKPVLTGQKPAVRDVLYGVCNGGTKPGMRSVKHGDWKLIQYDVMNGAVRETQLFNLKDNPEEFLAEHHDPKVIALTGVKPTKEQTNLANDPKHAAKLAEMQGLLLTEMRRLNDPWRLWNQPADGLAPPTEGPPSGRGRGKRGKKEK